MPESSESKTAAFFQNDLVRFALLWGLLTGQTTFQDFLWSPGGSNDQESAEVESNDAVFLDPHLAEHKRLLEIHPVD